jgi:hypothetical protein
MPGVGAFLVGLGLPVALDFAAVSPGQQWRQVVQLHNSAATAHLPDVTPAHDIVLRFLELDAGLSVLALAGLASLALYRRWRELVFVGLWLLGTLVMLLLFRPLFPHHAAILLPPLGVAAGVAVGLGPDALRNRRREAMGAVTLAALTYLGLVVRIAHDDRHALFAAGMTPSDTLATLIADRTGAGDLIAADDVRAADLSGRLVAPSLCDPSTVRLKAGYLTAQDLIEATMTYQVRLVAPTTGLFAQVPAYMTWLKRNYREVRGPGKTTVYVRP